MAINLSSTLQQYPKELCKSLFAHSAKPWFFAIAIPALGSMCLAPRSQHGNEHIFMAIMAILLFSFAFSLFYQISQHTSQPIDTTTHHNSHHFYLLASGLIMLLSLFICYIGVNVFTFACMLLCGSCTAIRHYAFKLSPMDFIPILIMTTGFATVPLIGWTAVSHHINPTAIVLYAIVFSWTPLTIWAYGMQHYHQHKQAFTLTHMLHHGSMQSSARLCFLYGLVTIVFSYLPYMVHLGNHLYLIMVTVLNIALCFITGITLLTTTPKHCKLLYAYNHAYLSALFIMLLISHFVHSQI